MSLVSPFQLKMFYHSVKNHFLKALTSLLASFICRQEQGAGTVAETQL